MYLLDSKTGANGGRGGINFGDSGRDSGDAGDNVSGNIAFGDLFNVTTTEYLGGASAASALSGDGATGGGGGASYFSAGGYGGGSTALSAGGGTNGSGGGGTFAQYKSSRTGGSGGNGFCRIHYEVFTCDHYYSDYVTTSQATCTNQGTLTRTCAVCKTQDTQSIPALGHSYVQTARIDATETETGSITYTCKRCRNSYKETIDALGYEFINSTGYAMWDEQGFTAGGRIKANTTVTFRLYQLPFTNPSPSRVSVTGATLDSYNPNTGECSISDARGTVEIKAVNN
jgi:hypothetical protein